MSEKILLIKEDPPRVEFILNRPEQRNALNPDLIFEVDKAFSHYQSNEDFRVVVLKGQGKAFCSGADLNHLKKMQKYSTTENLQDSERLANLYLKIYQYPKPVIAVVNGPALAGGCGLASVCDFIIATPSAYFGYPEVKIGFIAALVSVFLIRQLGERKARELLLTGNIFSAEEALELGFINQLVAEEELKKVIQDLINLLQKNSPLALENTKQLFNQDIGIDLFKLAAENAKFRETSDFTEGIRAFLENRQPNWMKTN